MTKSDLKQLERHFDCTLTETVNKRYCFAYFQHGRNSYENYTFWTDGKMTIKDEPVGAGHRAKSNVSLFRQAYQDGKLTVDVEGATWFIAIKHIATRDDKAIHARSLLFAHPDADLSSIKAKITTARFGQVDPETA